MAKWNWDGLWEDENPYPGRELWDVGNGVQVLNGTHDMMGNVWEWMESPRDNGDHGTTSPRGLRGGSIMNYGNDALASSYRSVTDPYYEIHLLGFRVASEVPEPATFLFLALGGLTVLRRQDRLCGIVWATEQPLQSRHRFADLPERRVHAG